MPRAPLPDSGADDRWTRRQAGWALDAANFFLAEVRDGLGPYLAIYLLTEQRWDEARIGVVMSVATIAGIVESGYSVALLTLGAVAAFDFGLHYFAMPEARASASDAEGSAKAGLLKSSAE